MRGTYLSICFLALVAAPCAHGQALSGTKLLEGKHDFAKVMVDGLHRFLDREADRAEKNRPGLWKLDMSSTRAYEKSLQPHRDRLKKNLGVIDMRLPPALEKVGTATQSSLIAETQKYRVYTVRWPVLRGVYGEGLLLEPTGEVRGSIVAIPDAHQTPESLVFPEKGDKRTQFARHLAEYGCRVLVVTLVDRKDTWSGSELINRFTNQPHREFVYRMAFEMGRHLIGYEVQKVLAAVDWFAQDKEQRPIGVYGYGEGGLIAWMAGALDPRIHTTCVSGYFGPNKNLHEEPIYRNVWGLLNEFGPRELARMIVPRHFILEHAAGPVIAGPPPPSPGRAGAAPGQLTAVPAGDEGVEAWQKLLGIWGEFAKDKITPFQTSAQAEKLFGHSAPAMMGHLTEHKIALPKDPPTTTPRDRRADFDPAPRQKRQVDQLVDFTQNLMSEAVRKRNDLVWSRLDTSSLEKYEKSTEPLRKFFWEEIVGKLPEPSMPLNPRTRLLYKTAKWSCYEVVLDVYEDVISYGLLLVPLDLKPGEKRPCVVCQHGLEGRPTDVVSPNKKTPYYNSFGSELADLGFVVFAPQNPYIFRNHFRQAVRKANPLQLSLYSFIVRQHQRILEFLALQPFVDASRIAYYGLSYGGKVAMRIPAILTGYCLSICSGDFNEWIWKNIALSWQSTYMFTGEYEMYEFDLGNTFNYAEMAALIAPRPFMVERGHNDGVGLDEYVAFEYAKVRRLYAKLGIPQRTTIEFFSGGHECHLVGTVAFLRQHLNWPGK